MSDKKKTPKEFSDKMDWEGGVEQLIRYGGRRFVDEYSLPPLVVFAWRRLSDALDDWDTAANELPEPGVDQEQEE